MSFAEITNLFVSLAWGPWLVFLLVGSGIFFSFFSRFIPFRNLKKGFKYMFQKEASSEGSISKYQALSSALSGTIGLGNIAGVALAIQLAGPGAVFWMWITACLGIATKFFTCSLSVMYREKDSDGTILGVPRYVIKNGLSSKWAFLAYLFAFFGMIGGLPAVQSNQMVQIISEFALPFFSFDNQLIFNMICGLIIAVLAGTVIIGGLTRIAKASSWLVPIMGGLYVLTATFILIANFEDVPSVIKIIFSDAFTGTSVAGGTLMGVIMYGIQRGAFSNEAGIGTEALIHGTAKTNNPIKQGFVAMIGPIFDTLLICTATAVVIILSGLWMGDQYSGVSLTAMAFQTFLGSAGIAVVFLCVVFFGISTIFTYSYYGSVCARFLFGPKGQRIYLYIFIATIIFFASISLDSAINIIDGSFAMMAIPTLISSIILAPKVIAEANKFLAR